MQLGPLPALATGTGAPLLYLGGLLPTAGVDRAFERRSAEFSARPLAGLRRVIYTNRRPGLHTGLTIGELATEHAEAISALDTGPVDVVGVSTGGSIAQQLAADHPDAVRRLVLIGTGCRLSPETRRLQAQAARDVRGGQPQRALASAALSVLVPRGEAFTRVVSPFMTPLARGFGDLSDLAVTIEAEDAFDLARCERAIAAPTLIVAGARDRFYPRGLLEETQQLIPGSVLVRIPRRGHLTVMSSRRLPPLLRGFLGH